jgi:hypothetical protein
MDIKNEKKMSDKSSQPEVPEAYPLTKYLFALMIIWDLLFILTNLK